MTTPPEDVEALAYRLFDEFLKAAPKDTSAWIDERCGSDAALRSEVERLLAADEAPLDLAGIALENAQELVPQDLVTLSHGGEATGDQIGAYRILRRIGEGGMAVVYEAERENPRRRVALKVLRDALPSASAARRFRTEAEVLAQLDHPGISTVFELGTATGEAGPVLYIAMELVDGGPLDDWIAKTDPGMEQRLELAVELCEAVGHAHARGVVHRDLKPANCLIDQEGKPKVVDFGIARVLNLDAGTLAKTQTGHVLGTLAYMSPEQLRGEAAKIGPTSDVYTLGVMLYEMLVGRRPFGDQQPLSSLMADAELREPEAAHAVNPAIPRDVSLILGKALAGETKRRYADATELATDLRRFLAHEPIHARPTTTLYRLTRLGRRHRTTLLASAVTALALLGLIGMNAGIEALKASGERAAQEAGAEQRRVAMQEDAEKLREGGRDTDANALFDDFVRDPTVARTGAAGRAWLGRGRSLSELRDLDGARSALGRAYAAATDEDEQVAALGALTELLWKDARWDSLASVLDLLDREHPDAVLPERAKMDAQLALLNADLVTAGSLLEADDPLRDVLDLTAGATRLAELGTGHRTTIAALDVDGDGLDELFWSLNSNDVMVRRDGATGSLDRIEIAPLTLFPYGAMGQLVLSDKTHRMPGVVAREPAKGANTLVGISTDGPREFARWEGEAVLSVTMFESSRGVRLLAGSAWADNRFWMANPSDGQVTSADTATEAWASYITAMLPIDLDDDGSDELVLALGPDEGFDLRVLRATQADVEDPFALLARHRIGYISALASLRASDGRRLIAAAAGRSHADAQIFPDGDHRGYPTGVYLFALEGTELVQVGAILLPDKEIKQVLVTDADGDGLDDLLIDHGTLLARQVPSTAGPRVDFALSYLSRLAVRQLAQLDDDPALELVIEQPSSRGVAAHGDGSVKLGELWALGLGEGLPPTGLATREESKEHAPHSSRLSPALARALHLGQLGLVDEAAERVTDLAHGEPDPKGRSDAFELAAELWSRSRSRGRVLASRADALVQASRHAPTDGRLLRSAIEALSLAGEERAALELARSASTDDRAPKDLLAWATESVLRLTSRLAPERRTTIDFGKPLDPAWELTQPLLVRRNARARTLDVDAFRGSETIARIPLVRSTGPVGMSLEFTVERAEHGTRLDFELRPRADPGNMVAITTDAGGWGGVLTRYLGTRGQAGGYVLNKQHGERSSDSVRYRAEVTWEGPELFARGERVGETLDFRVREAAPNPPEHREWELVVRTRSTGGIENTWLSARLHEIELRGFVLDTVTPANSSPSKDQRFMELITRQRADPDELRHLLADPDIARAARAAMRLDPITASAALRTAISEGDVVALARRALASVLDTPSDDATVAQALRAVASLALARIESDQDARVLLIANARAHLAAGDAASARFDLERTAAFVVRERGSDPCFAVEALLAEIAAGEQREDSALDHVERALRCAPSDLLGHERLTRHPGLRDWLLSRTPGALMQGALR